MGVDAFFGGPPETTQPIGAQVDIELWWGLSDSAQPPDSAGFWSINTSDFSDFSSAGSVILGSTFAQFDFNLDDPDGAPPLITSASDIWVMFKFNTGAQERIDYWGTAQCTALPQFGICGCQPIGSGHDSITTPQVNVLRTIGLGVGSGDSKTWTYAEEFGVEGDIIARLRVEAADGQIGGNTCTPSCSGLICGDDGCGGSCGSCGDNEACVAGQCEATGGGV